MYIFDDDVTVTEFQSNWNMKESYSSYKFSEFSCNYWKITIFVTFKVYFNLISVHILSKENVLSKSGVLGMARRKVCGKVPGGVD